MTLSALRSILIISLLGLSLNSLYSFQQSALKKTRYEFTDTRISEADTLLKKRQYQEALTAYQKAYDTYEAEEFYEGMVYAMERMGEALRRLRRFSSSQEILSEAKSISRNQLVENHLLLSKVYLTLGLNKYSQRRYLESSGYVDSAGTYYRRSEFYDSTLIKRIIDYKFYTYFFSSQSRDTMIFYLNERSRYYDINQPTSEEKIYLLSDYSRAYFNMGDFQKGVAYALEGVRVCESLEQDVPSGAYRDVLFNLSRQLVSQKEYKRALGVTEKLIAFTELKEPKSTALLGYYNLKAVILNGLERYEEAIFDFEKIIRVFEERKSFTAFYRNTLLNLGVSYQLMGDYVRAESYLKEALNRQKSVWTCNKKVDIILSAF